MSKEEWFRHYERRVNNGEPMGTATVERARQDQIATGSDLDRADEAKKRERGE